MSGFTHHDHSTLNQPADNHLSLGRVSIPILDRDATVTFYAVYKKQNRQKLKDFLKLIQ